jgi:hypothetical protein
MTAPQRTQIQLEKTVLDIRIPQVELTGKTNSQPSVSTVRAEVIHPDDDSASVGEIGHPHENGQG